MSRIGDFEYMLETHWMPLPNPPLLRPNPPAQPGQPSGDDGSDEQG
jgi:hypothetical protein